MGICFGSRGGLLLTLSEPGKLKLTDPVELVQGLLAVIVISAVAFNAAVAHPIPPEVMLLATAVVGFYFGKSVQSETIARHAG